MAYSFILTFYSCFADNECMANVTKLFAVATILAFAGVVVYACAFAYNLVWSVV